jgi:tetratricopeptide (TPR) repeat protein
MKWSRTKEAGMTYGIRWILAVASVSPSLAVAQDRTGLMSESALQENWSRVADLAAGGVALSPVEHLLAGHAELALNRNNDSLADFLTVTDPSDIQQWRDWAHAFRAQNPGSAVAWYFEGDSLARMRDWPGAIGAFDAGLKIEPANALLLNARGVSYAASWDLDHALVDLTLATKASPQFADAFVSLGSAWVQQQRGAMGATRALDRALAISPDSEVALILRSGVRMVQGEFPAAQADAGYAVKEAGQLTPAVQARLLDIAELLRSRPQHEVEVALASGLNPGMLINRELQNLQQGQPGSFDKLMTIGQMFPDQRPAIASGIQSSVQTSPSALQSVNAGFARQTQADMLTRTVGSPTNLTLGPAYAMAIGLSQDSRMNPVPAPPPSPRVDFYAVANNLNTATTVAQAMKDSIPENLIPKRISFGADGGLQGLQLLGAGLSDLGASRNGNFNFAASNTLEQLGHTGLWGLGAAGEGLVSAGRISQSFANGMSLLDPLQNLTSGFASQIGGGRWLPNQTEQGSYLSAAHGLLSADYNLQFTLPGATKTLTDLGMGAKLGWSGALGATAVLPDLANLATSRMQGAWNAPVTVNQSISGLDAITKGTWYAAAFMASGGNTTIASGAATLAGVAADRGRAWTMPLFQQLEDFGTKAQIDKIYDSYTASQAARGLPSVSESAFLNPLAPPRIPDTSNWATVQNQYSFTSFGHTITGSSTISRTDLANPIDPMTTSSITRSSQSYTETFNGALANQAINQSVPKPAEVNMPKPVFTPPAPTPDFTSFRDSLMQSVGSGTGAATAPGGFRTGIARPNWEDGDWPITPWYGLGYVVSERPAKDREEVRK